MIRIPLKSISWWTRTLPPLLMRNSKVSLYSPQTKCQRCTKSTKKLLKKTKFQKRKINRGNDIMLWDYFSIDALLSPEFENSRGSSKLWLIMARKTTHNLSNQVWKSKCNSNSLMSFSQLNLPIFLIKNSRKLIISIKIFSIFLFLLNRT